MKVWEFIQDMDSHGIYRHKELAVRFKEQTGFEPCWPTHSAGKISAIAGQDPKGPIAPLALDDHERVFNGWEMAAALEEKFAGTNHWSHYHGRGSSFRASVQALKQANV